MAFEIRTATPESAPIIIGLTSPSGGGKTLSALRLAHGIQSVTGGEIGIMDTEGRRALRYADKAKWPGFSFKHLPFDPPFTSARYLEAMRALKDAGCKTVIVDSMSHEHEGAGGYLEFHDREMDRLAGDDFKKRERMTFTAWIKPAAERRKLINGFLQMGINFIFCFRAKEKLRIVSGGEPVPLGWQAIAGEEFVYEMIARCLLLPGAQGVPDWSKEAFKHNAAKRDNQDAHLFPDGKQLSEAIGRAIALDNAAKSLADTTRGKTPATSDIPAELILRETELANEAALRGTAALRGWFTSLDPEMQTALTAVKDALKPTAKLADTKTPGDEAI